MTRPESEEVSAYKPHRRETRRPPRAPLSTEERARIRRVGAEEARRSRLRQGLPERIEDLAAIAVLVALLRTTRSTRNLESTSDETNHAA